MISHKPLAISHSAGLYLMAETIVRNIDRIRQVISALCAKAGRNPREITIVAVTKGRTVEQIREVIAQDIADIGENRIQEALIKYDTIPAARYAPRLKWHMIGHLQTNKVIEAVRLFDLIQSVDSPRVAEEINRQAQRFNKVQDILVEVNISAEPSKFGVQPDDTFELIEKIAGLKNIRIKGLMGIAPITGTPEKSRPYFRMLKELSEKIDWRLPAAVRKPIISMGMSDDFVVAIEEGANMIRLGRAIFR